ncbi:hypothetical protein E4T39_08796 [Aureobasidium subglaciale]|nr:hypothetical protein E4T39_08796 [Aureobasidium subglaciale]
MKYAVVATALFGAVMAQNSTTGAVASGCVAKYDTCRTTRVNGLSANQAQCASDNAKCQSDCSTAYDTCRSTRVNGLSANQALCASQYAACLGENPFDSNGSNTVLPNTSSANSTATATYGSGMVYVTEVVTAVTTVCPAPTAAAYVTTIADRVFTVSSATTITITDCPCTITKPVAPTGAAAPPAKGSMIPSGNGTGVVTKPATATTTKPVAFTGAAAHVGAGLGFLGAAAGAVMLL